MSEYAHFLDTHTHTPHTHTYRLRFKLIDNRRNVIQALSYMCSFIEKHLKITTELECSIGEPMRDIDSNSYTARRRVLVINRIVV